MSFRDIKILATKEKNINIKDNFCFPFRNPFKTKIIKDIYLSGENEIKSEVKKTSDKKYEYLIYSLLKKYNLELKEISKRKNISTFEQMHKVNTHYKYNFDIQPTDAKYTSIFKEPNWLVSHTHRSTLYLFKWLYKMTRSKIGIVVIDDHLDFYDTEKELTKSNVFYWIMKEGLVKKLIFISSKDFRKNNLYINGNVDVLYDKKFHKLKVLIKNMISEELGIENLLFSIDVDCLDKEKYFGFEYHPLRKIFVLTNILSLYPEIKNTKQLLAKEIDKFKKDDPLHIYSSHGFSLKEIIDIIKIIKKNTSTLLGISTKKSGKIMGDFTELSPKMDVHDRTSIAILEIIKSTHSSL